MNKKNWYVVHTYSGFEQKAKKALEEKIKSSNLSEKFGEILIPSEDVVVLVRGKKRTANKKFFPGYMLVQMELDDETWHLVKNTPKVTGFVGGTTNPPFISDEEVQKITSQISEGTLKPKHKLDFEKGEPIRVVDGPFSNFNGIVDDVKPEKGKLRVLVSIFGRATSVELDYMQVEKVT